MRRFNDYRSGTVGAMLGFLTLVAPSASAQLHPAKTGAQKEQTRGTTQLAGGYVRFGQTYSLKSGVNFTILKAAYTMNAVPMYGEIQNSPTEKVVVFDVSAKNWKKDSDFDFGGAGGDFMTLYDAAGNHYNGEAELKSDGIKSVYLTLKPGQGVGQPALNDPYRVAFRVPLDAVITKVMVNQPRVGKDEKVLRYVLDPADKEFDPINVIAPLPAEVRDPANRAGAVALPQGKATVNAILPAGGFTYQVTKIETNAGTLGEGYTPSDGHHYVVATLKVTNVDLRNLEYFDGKPRDAYVVDADGDKHTLAGMIKASSTEEAPGGVELAPGESKTLRLVFELSGPAAESLVLAGSYYPWKFDLKGL